MKHKKGFVYVLLAVTAVVLAVVMMTCSPTQLFYFEQKSGDGVQASYLYLDDERTYTFEIDSTKYCEVEIETNGGAYYMEVVDASGESICADTAIVNKSYIFDSDEDITVHFKFMEHSGKIRIILSDEMI